MFRIYTFVSAFFITIVSFAQNIVQNPEFELYSQCPPFLGNINFCTGWSAPNGGTTDYFNSCDTVYVGVPSNHCGYQQAASGNAYAGFMTYEGNWPNYREYLMGNMLNMVVGQHYKVNLKVSLAGKYAFASDGIAILFTVDSFYSGNSGVLPQTPQIDFSDLGPITDTTNWVTLTDTFYADSAYTRLTIGAFKHDSLLDMDTVYGYLPEAYYFIDDVEILPIALGITHYVPQNNAVTIYPYPLALSSEIKFDNPRNERFAFRLFDLHGREVACIINIHSDHFTVGKGSLTQGVYYYQLISSTQRYAGKLIVK